MRFLRCRPEARVLKPSVSAGPLGLVGLRVISRKANMLFPLSISITLVWVDVEKDLVLQ